MNAATRQRVELAQKDARRRRHATTEPEHLLAISLDFDAVLLAVHARGLDPNELRQHLEIALAAIPTAGSYRDGAVESISPRLARALGRCQRWIRAVSLLDTLFEEPSIAAVVWLLRRGEDERYVIQRSRALAIMRHHEVVRVEHALRAMVDLRSFVETLERAGGAAAPLRSALDAELAPERENHVVPKPDVRLRQLLVSAKFPRTDDAPATIREVCIALARDGACAPYWSAAGIGPSAFLDAVLVPK